MIFSRINLGIIFSAPVVPIFQVSPWYVIPSSHKWPRDIMVGIVSFAFSTILITFFGEIILQAYFSRNALRMTSILAPVIRLYQVVLYPVAKPSAILLDFWLGKEITQFFTEKNIKLFLKKHIEGSTTEIGHIEDTGANNFLSLDDMTIEQEGENINPDSIIP